jgi:hypothetical protein
MLHLSIILKTVLGTHKPINQQEPKMLATKKTKYSQCKDLPIEFLFDPTKTTQDAQAIR